MCARECLAGEKCDRKAACEVADSTYGPRIRFRQIQLAEDQLLGLQGREERKPTRDRRQAKPNMIYARGMAR